MKSVAFVLVLLQMMSTGTLGQGHHIPAGPGDDEDYKAAVFAEKQGRLSEAMSNYARVSARHSALAPFALAHLSRIARSTGDLTLERLYISRLRLLYPSSVLAGASDDHLAQSLIDAGNYAGAITLLTLPGSGESNARVQRDRLALLGKASMLAGDSGRARQIFTSLLDRVADAARPDDAAQTAVRNLDELDVGSDQTGKSVADLPEAEHMRRAAVYQFMRDFDNASLHYRAVISRFAGSPNAALAMVQLGRAAAQEGDHPTALEWFRKVLEQYPEQAVAKDALLGQAASFSRSERADEALRSYQSYIEKYPSDERVDRAYFNTIDVLRDAGRDSDALDWCGRTAAVFKGRPAEALAIFAAARIYIAGSEWQSALAKLDQLKGVKDLGTTIPGGTNSAEVAFIRAFALEQLGRSSEAVDAYLAINDGRNEYYGWRSTLRLDALAAKADLAGVVSEKIYQLASRLDSPVSDQRWSAAASIIRITIDPGLRQRAVNSLRQSFKPPAPVESNGQMNPLVTRLISMGCFEEAAVVLRASAGPVADTGTAKIMMRGDQANQTLAFIEPIWRTQRSDLPIELIPRDQAELLYPIAYKDDLLRESASRGIDPRLLLAIMRQESDFMPDAKSNASARGLMQFILPTADRFAVELGLSPLRGDELYDPTMSIRLGAQYAADLLRIFPDQPDAVAASYNGGEDNVKRWVERSRSDLPERYIPEIMFAQTKDYAYKVMSNYRMYTYLYDKDLDPTPTTHLAPGAAQPGQ